MPAGAMALSAVLKAVESAGYAPVEEVEFEKDHWKIKAWSNGQLLQLKVDLVTGHVIPNPQPKADKPLSEVVKSLEDHGYGPILDVERGEAESGGSAAWEIEAYKGKSEVKVKVDPATGTITAK
ncbi:MAG TPA: PepSY domain-containing protein [Candidatus Acidoferrales bacterium]|nr:PepSY domain-containing protein [Candidatus Acidoferrales bacterium]